MSFELAVLGSSGMYPDTSKACSGYLFRTSDAQVMVDCGPGSTVNLGRFTTYEAIDAILLTHLHTDHCLDLIGFYYARWFTPAGPQPIDVYAPPGAAHQLRAVITPDATDAFEEVCRFRTIAAGDKFDIGRMSFQLFESRHPVPTVSVRVSCEDTVAVYSSDSEGGAPLVEAAAGADLLLCEATWESDAAHVAAGGHMSAGRAGAVARDAGVRRLVLTHLRPGNDPERSIAEARRFFAGPIEVASDGDVWILA